MNKIEEIFHDKKVTAVLDSCVLFPAQLRDIFMHLALNRVFRPRWSDEIHNEWIRAVLRNRPDLSNQQLQRTRSLMDSNVNTSRLRKYSYRLAIVRNSNNVYQIDCETCLIIVLDSILVNAIQN